MRYSGIVCKTAGNDQLAMEYYKKGKEYAKDCNTDLCKTQLSEIYQNIASLYLNQGKYEKSIDCYYKALNLYSELGDPQGEAFAYNSIAIVHIKQGNFEKAEEYWLKAIDIQKVNGFKLGLADSYNNMANLYAEQKNHDKAQD